jgi:hypothetical protein
MKMARIVIGVSLLIGGVWPEAGQADLNSGLVGYYTFNGNADDMSGRGNNGTIYGGAATFTTDRWGHANGALHFDGIDDYVLLPNESQFDLTEFSIMVAVKIPDYSQYRILISKGPWYGNYSMNLSPDSWSWMPGGTPGYVHDTSDGNWSMAVANSPVPLDEYVQLVVTYSADDGWCAYMNGSLEVGPYAAPAPVLTDVPVSIGAPGGLGSFFLGDIDEVRIYDRVLTASEVGALNAQAHPVVVPVPGSVILCAVGIGLLGRTRRRRSSQLPGPCDSGRQERLRENEEVR